MSGIEISNLCRHWGEVKAVDNVSFTVPDKTFTVLLGPSGCGKSTLLRMICGLESITSGRVHIDGRDVTDVDASNRGVSMVFQSYALFPHLTVKENIQFGLKVRKVPAKEREQRVKQAADMVGLSELLNRRPANLSGGQRQRVALARSIVSEHSVCLMDEPLSNLDAKLRAEMRDQIRSLQQRLSLTVVYVTHDQVEAMSMADQIVLLELGQVKQVSAPAELYTQPTSIFAAQFIGVPPMNILDCQNINDGLLPDSIQTMLAQGNKPAFIGVRPEHISIEEKGFPTDVFAVDYFGGETVVRAKHQETNVFLKLAGQPKIQPGQQLHISWSLEETHLFDNQQQRI